MPAKRPALIAIAELYVEFDITPSELGRAVAFRRKIPRECESCGHYSGEHCYPKGWCAGSLSDGSECECEAMFARGKAWRVL